MSPHQIISIAVRLFAVWLAVFIVGSLPRFIHQISVAQSQQAAIAVYAVFALILGMVAWLWFFPRSVAHRLLPASEGKSSAPASPDEYYSLGCSLIGLWAMVASLPGVARYVLGLMVAARQGPGVISSATHLH